MIVVMSIIAAITIIVVIMQVITQTDQTQLTQTDQTRSEYETREITISDIRITVEIADDNEKIIEVSNELLIYDKFNLLYLTM